MKKSFRKIDYAKHMHEVKQMSNWYIKLYFFASLFSNPKSSQITSSSQFTKKLFSKSVLASQFCDSIVLWFRVEPDRPGSNPDSTTYLINWILSFTAIKWDSYSKDYSVVTNELLPWKFLELCLACSDYSTSVHLL